MRMYDKVRQTSAVLDILLVYAKDNPHRKERG